jgi:hypothetical protein
MHARPDLAGLHYLNSRTTSPSPGGSSQDFDFTPNQRKDEVYCRLVRSARITLGYDTPLVSQTTGERELVELCAGVWGIQHKTISELETTFEIWSNCLGQEEEDEAVGSRRMMKSGARKRASYTEEFGWAERVLEDLLELALDAGAGLEHDEVSFVEVSCFGLLLIGHYAAGTIRKIHLGYPVQQADQPSD